MTEEQFENALNAIGTLMRGTVTITKERGNDKATVETTVHPWIGLYCCLFGVEEMLWRAMNTNDDLELDVESKEEVKEILSGMMELIVNGVAERMEKREARDKEETYEPCENRHGGDAKD